MSAPTSAAIAWLTSGWRSRALIVTGLFAAQQAFEYFRIYYALESPGPAGVAIMTLSGAPMPLAVVVLLCLADESTRMLFSVLVTVGALQIVQRFSGAGTRWTIASIAIMLSSVMVGMLLRAFLLPWLPGSVQLGVAATLQSWFWYQTWMSVLIAMLSLVMVNRLGVRSKAMERLAKVQERSRRVRQQLAFAQLQAIQARVDPQLLFEILTTVKSFYEHDATRAERLLDDLTTFLRAALPRLKSVRSSLEAEFGLVTCYLRMLRSAGHVPVDLQLSLPERLADAIFPAGVLLPLLARPAAAGGSAMLDAQAAGSSLRVNLLVPHAPQPSVLQQLSAALTELYGDRARLAIEADASGVAIELEVPHERE